MATKPQPISRHLPTMCGMNTYPKMGGREGNKARKANLTGLIKLHINIIKNNNNNNWGIPWYIMVSSHYFYVMYIDTGSRFGKRDLVESKRELIFSITKKIIGKFPGTYMYSEVILLLCDVYRYWF